MTHLRFILACAALVVTPSLGRAQSAVGRSVIIRGAVQAQGPGGALRGLGAGDVVYPGDTINTEADGHARLLMQDKSVLDLGPGSSMRIADYSVDNAVRKATVKVIAGRLWARVRSFFGESRFVIEGRNAVAGVRGTELIFEVDAAGQVHLSVIEGSVELTSLVDQAAEMIGAMHQGTAGSAGVHVTPMQEEARRALLGGLRPSQALGDAEKATLVEQLGALLGPSDLGGEPPAASDIDERLGGLSPDFATPTLDLDPGQVAGNDVVINGRVVVEP